MNGNRFIGQLKYGLIGGLTGGLGSYITIEFVKVFNKSVDIATLSLVPFLFLIPIILIITDVIDFKKMYFGYIPYILGYIISLFILMDAGVITKFWGWIYIIISMVIILCKIEFFKFIIELCKR